MKRGFVVLLIIVLSSTLAHASLWDFLMSAVPQKDTTLVSSFSDPIKVYPGQTLKVVVELEDTAGITQANAFFYHEKGSDKVSLTLIASNNNNHYTYVAVWEVHDTINLKWYKTDFKIINKKGKIISGTVDWQDPTQSHPAAELAPGTFPAGDFTFQGQVTAGIFNGAGAGLTGIASSLTSGNSQAVPWTGIVGIPLDIANGDQVGITSESDPTVLASVKNGVSWNEVTDKPAITTYSFTCQTKTARCTHGGYSGCGVTAVCDPGYILTGGGFISPLLSWIEILYASRPSGNGWYGYVHDSGYPSNGDLTVYARCCKI